MQRMGVNIIRKQAHNSLVNNSTKHIWKLSMSANYEKLMGKMGDAKDIAGILKKNPALSKDKDFFFYVMDHGEFDQDSLSYFSDTIKDDKDVVFKIVSTWPHEDGFKHASARLRGDRDMAHAAIKGRAGNLKFISDELKNDQSFMFNLVASVYMGDSALKYLPESYCSNREFINVLLKHDYQSFALISKELQNDPDITWRAMFECGVWHAPTFCFKYAGPAVQTDKELFKKIIAQVKGFRGSKELLDELKEAHKLALANLKGADAGALAQVKIELKKLKKEVAEADSWNANKLNKQFTELISRLKSFSSNKKIMEAAIEVDIAQKSFYVKNIGQSLTLPDIGLQKDMVFWGAIMKATDGRVYEYLPEAVRSTPEFLLNNMSIGVSADAVPTALREDPQYLLHLVETLASSGRLSMVYRVKYLVDKKLMSDKNFIESFAMYEASILDDASVAIKKDKSIFKKALTKFPNCISYAHPSVLADEALLIESVKNGGYAFLDKLSMDQLSNQKLMLELIKASKKDNNLARNIMRSVGYELKKDKELAKACVAINGWAIESVDESIKYDKDILIAAFKSGAHVYKELDMEKLRSLFDITQIRNMAGTLFTHMKIS
jgi:hypothetical protein